MATATKAKPRPKFKVPAVARKPRTATKNKAALSGIVLKIEQALAAICRNQPDVSKNIAVVVGSKGRLNVYGYHYAGRWQITKETKAAELLIAAEFLNRHPRLIFTTLLHECVHSAASNLEISDTSQDGKYHNGRFAELARQFGLVVERDPRCGYATPDITDETFKKYKRHIDALGRATKMYRHAEIDYKRPKNKNLLVLRCECDEINQIRASAGRRDKGIVCSDCGSLFDGEAP